MGIRIDREATIANVGRCREVLLALESTYQAAEHVRSVILLSFREGSDRVSSPEDPV
jgi:hypothetical protein